MRTLTMPEPAPSEPFPKLPGKILLGFGALLLVVAIFTAIDARQRAQLEWTFKPSGLGDREYFLSEKEFKTGDQVVKWMGMPLVRSRETLSNKKDWLMQTWLLDDSERWTVYQELYEKEETPPPAHEFYLKTAPHKYLPLHAPQDAELLTGMARLSGEQRQTLVQRLDEFHRAHPAPDSDARVAWFLKELKAIQAKP